MAQPFSLPMAQTVNNMTLFAAHHTMSSPQTGYYNAPHTAAGYVGDYWDEAQSYQRMVRLANIQQGESVLDVAAGPGLAGLLACEILGGKHPSVFFADASATLLEQAQTELSRRFPELRGNHCWQGDIREANAPTMVKAFTGRAAGFDVVLVHQFLNHFEPASRPRLIAHLRTLLAPGGRLVVQFDAPSPSRHLGGQPHDAIAAGWRLVVRNKHWDISAWTMTTAPRQVDKVVAVTRGDRNRLRDDLRQIITSGGGTPGSFETTLDLSNPWRDITQRIQQRATPTGPGGSLTASDIDTERRIAITQYLQDPNFANVIQPQYQPKVFMLGMHMVCT